MIDCVRDVGTAIHIINITVHNWNMPNRSKSTVNSNIPVIHKSLVSSWILLVPIQTQVWVSQRYKLVIQGIGFNTHAHSTHTYTDRW